MLDSAAITLSENHSTQAQIPLDNCLAWSYSSLEGNTYYVPSWGSVIVQRAGGACKCV